MQTKYYLSFEQVGIIRRIPLKEQDPDMQGILDAFIKAFRIANELGDEEEVTTPDLINSLNHIDLMTFTLIQWRFTRTDSK